MKLPCQECPCHPLQEGMVHMAGLIYIKVVAMMVVVMVLKVVVMEMVMVMASIKV